MLDTVTSGTSSSQMTKGLVANSFVFYIPFGMPSFAPKIIESKFQSLVGAIARVSDASRAEREETECPVSLTSNVFVIVRFTQLSGV